MLGTVQTEEPINFLEILVTESETNAAETILQIIKSRRRRPVMRNGQIAPSGLSLNTLWKKALTKSLSSQAFTNAMQQLHRGGTITIAGQITFYGSGKCKRHSVVLSSDSIPSWFDFLSDNYEADYEGQRIPSDTFASTAPDSMRWPKRLNTNHIIFRFGLVYVNSDGLPASVSAKMEWDGVRQTHHDSSVT